MSSIETGLLFLADEIALDGTISPNDADGVRLAQDWDTGEWTCGFYRDSGGWVILVEVAGTPSAAVNQAVREFSSRYKVGKDHGQNNPTKR